MNSVQDIKFIQVKQNEVDAIELYKLKKTNTESFTLMLD